MAKSEQIYAASPVWLQNAIVSTYGWAWRRVRLGGRWPEFTRQFQERDQWNRAQWRDFTVTKMRQVLLTAAERVPYYRDEWRRLGITPDRLRQLEPEDLPSLPILSKDVVRRSPKDLLIDGVVPKGSQIHHTSGSTGTPIATYWTPTEMQRSVAMREARSAGWAGVSYLQPRATFSGRLVVPDPYSAGPYHRYNVFEGQVYFSPFHLSPATAGQYVAALQKYKPTWFNGYAHSYYTLARFAKEQGLDCPSPKAIVTTSEKVTPSMRVVMQDVFGCKVFEEYGTVEDVMYACECEKGSLHVNPDAGVLEIIDESGQPVAPGKPGRLVATGFVRDHQLFVRYELGDQGTWAEGSCACGREMPVLQQVVGRTEDVVVGVDGRQMVRFHGIFADQPHVAEGQIVQQTLTDILVKVVPGKGFSAADAEEIRRRIQVRLTSAVQVEVVTVSEIPRTKSGKYQAVVSNLPSASPSDPA